MIDTQLTRTKTILPWLVAFALFMEILDTSILNTAVPSIAHSLNVNPLSLRATLTSYALSLAIFIPISGWISDRFGTHKVFCSAISVFILGSFLCGIAENLHWLIAARVIQGMGGALMVPVGRSVLVQTFEKKELIRAMSFVSIPALLGPVIGPTLGGIITDYLHWRWIFFVNIPIGCIGLYFALRYMPNYVVEKLNRLDMIGFILFCGGITGLSYALELLGEHHLSLQNVNLLISFSILLLAIYTFYALHTAFPVIDIRLLKIHTFKLAIIGGLITRLGLSGIPFILPLFYQLGFGLSPIQSGLLIIPQALGAIGMKTIVSKLLHQFSYRFVLVANTLGIGMILCLFGEISPTTPIWLIIITMTCLGLCSSLQYTCLNTLTYADIPQDRVSMSSSIASTVLQLSMSFGVAIAAVVIAFFLPNGQTYGVTQSTLFYAFNDTFRTLGLLTISSALIFYKLHKEDGNNIL